VTHQGATGQGTAHPMVGGRRRPRPLPPGAFFRGPGRYKASKRHSHERVQWGSLPRVTARAGWFRRETGFPPSRLQDGRLPLVQQRRGNGARTERAC